jgi:hypothetical protein
VEDKMTEKDLELEKIIRDKLEECGLCIVEINGGEECKSDFLIPSILTYIRQEQVKLLKGLLKRAEHLGDSTFKYIRESDIQQAISRIEKGE